MIKGIGHIAYNVLDMNKSLHFYCEVLGLEKAFEIHDEQDNPWIVYIKINKNQFIELFYTHDEKIKERPVIGYSHLCFEVDDIYIMKEQLIAHNIKLDVDIIQGKDKNLQCWVKDPDGNPIEFMQISENAPQSKY